VFEARRASRAAMEEAWEGWVEAREERRAGVRRMWRRSRVDFSRRVSGSQFSPMEGGGMGGAACCCC